MAEEEVEEVVSEESETADEELWESEEESPEDTEPSDTEEEVEEAEEEEESEDEDPAHDYEKRYKDLEREFHRRNEESARLREEVNDLRLNNLEQEKRANEPKGTKPADPTDADSFFDEDDRTTMDEFSEITGVTKKLIEHEVAKRLQALQPNLQKVDQMEQTLQDQNYNQFLRTHESLMLDSVGSDYREIDKNPKFQNWVLASPALTKMMTESVEATDHASVMNLWLDSTEHGKKYRPPREPPAQSTDKQATRRKAASSLMSNSAPRTQKNPDNMSDEELWDSVPE